MTKSESVSVSVQGFSTDVCPFGITGAPNKSGFSLGETLTITGKLWNGAGQYIPNAEVDLYRIDMSTGVQTLATKSQTDANGNYSISYVLNQAGQFSVFVRAPASSTCVGLGIADVTTNYFVISVAGGTTTGGPTAFTLVGTPTQSGTNVAVTYKNNTSAPVTGIIIADIRNQLGQTLATTTATLTNVPAGGTSSASIILSRMPPGTYILYFFVATPEGVVLSDPTQISVTI